MKEAEPCVTGRGIEVFNQNLETVSEEDRNALGANCVTDLREGGWAGGFGSNVDLLTIVVGRVRCEDDFLVDAETELERQLEEWGWRSLVLLCVT